MSIYKNHTEVEAEIKNIESKFKSHEDIVARSVAEWVILTLRWTTGEFGDVQLISFLDSWMEKRHGRKDDRVKEQESGPSSKVN